MQRRPLLLAGPLLLMAGLAAAQQPRPPQAPQPDLAAIQGAWRGQLTYRDYSQPDRMVTLPTRLFVALAGPAELVLHYVYDDGPGKTVYSYERMAFDFAQNTLTWTSGYPGTRTSQNRITSSQAQDGSRVIAFEREEGASVSRYVMTLGARALSLAKDEGTVAGGFQFRNRYVFARGEG